MAATDSAIFIASHLSSSTSLRYNGIPKRTLRDTNGYNALRALKRAGTVKMTKRAGLWCVVGVLTALMSVARPVEAQSRVESNVIYGMYSGLALLMDVYHPADPNGYGIVLIQGSGWTAPMGYDSGQLKEAGPRDGLIATVLAEAGYTVFSANIRQVPGFHYPDPVEDVQRAVRFVRHHASEFGIDPVRIGAIGWSSGAHLVSLLGVLDGEGDPDDPSPVNRESAKVQCVVAMAGIFDLARVRGNPMVVVATFMGLSLLSAGPKSIESRRYAQASPVTHVSADDPPFLLQSGAEDLITTAEQAQLMEAALKKADVPVRLEIIPGFGHVAEMNEEKRRASLGKAIEWFGRYLPGP